MGTGYRAWFGVQVNQVKIVRCKESVSFEADDNASKVSVLSTGMQEIINVW